MTLNKLFPSWMYVLPVKIVYDFDIIPPTASTEEVKLIGGGECHLWTENVTENQIYTRIGNRIEAHAKRSWTIRNAKDFDRFTASYQILSTYLARYFENFE